MTTTLIPGHLSRSGVYLTIHHQNLTPVLLLSQLSWLSSSHKAAQSVVVIHLHQTSLDIRHLASVHPLAILLGCNPLLERRNFLVFDLEACPGGITSQYNTSSSACGGGQNILH